MINRCKECKKYKTLIYNSVHKGWFNYTGPAWLTWWGGLPIHRRAGQPRKGISVVLLKLDMASCTFSVRRILINEAVSVFPTDNSEDNSKLCLPCGCKSATLIGSWIFDFGTDTLIVLEVYETQNNRQNKSQHTRKPHLPFMILLFVYWWLFIITFRGIIASV